MCEYCGCQAVDSIGLLTREHEAAVALIATARAAAVRGDVAMAARQAGELAMLLGPHTAVEEDGLFPELAEDFPDHVAALRAEHRIVETVLAEAPPDATAGPVDPTWLTRFVGMLDVLREHILKEQDGLFPAALSGLDAASWERVDVVRARVGSTLDVTPTGELRP